MKIISEKQINELLATIYQTNITAQGFDAIRKFLAELPEEPKKEEEKGE